MPTTHGARLSKNAIHFPRRSRRSFRRHGAAGCACRRNPEFLPPVALAFFCPVRGNEGDVRSRTTRQEHCTYERHPRLTQTVGGSRVNVRFRVSAARKLPVSYRPNSVVRCAPQAEVRGPYSITSSARVRIVGG